MKMKMFTELCSVTESSSFIAAKITAKEILNQKMPD